MFTKTPANKTLLNKKATCRKSYALALALSSTSLVTLATLVTGLSATTTVQAASLGDLFSNNKSDAQAKFLPVDQAFQVNSINKATAKGSQLAVNFTITPEHYVYKDQLKLTLPAGVSATPFTFNRTPVMIDDPTFGKVPVFDQATMVATTTLTSATGKSITNADLTIGWQGCAKAGLCYPPEKIKTTVTIAATATATNTNQDSIAKSDAESDAKNDSAEPATTNTITGADTNSISGDDTNSISGADSNTMSGADSNPVGDSISNINSAEASVNVDEADPFGLAEHPWLAMLLLFLAGLGLAFTPCVLPMLPIVANIVGRQENPTVKKGVILTTSYAIGVATAYGILGALIAVFGESLGIIGWLQNPIILISFAIVFVLLALYMLGLFSIRLPRALSSKMQGLSQAGDSKLGSAGGSLAAGFLSALVVSPCVSAPLFGALLAVSTIGSPLLGFAALFMLGFGLSAPLILIGATQGSIMPKAGEWMNWVKIGFALLLLAVALLLIERVFISSAMLLVWALWFMVVATWAWSWLGKGRILTQALGLIFGIWAIILVVGAALGNDDSLQPLESISATSMMQSPTGQIGSQNLSANHTTDKNITSLAELDAITAANPKVIVDVTAEWCIECRIMDKNLFTNRPAQMQDWQLVRLDITDTTEDSKAILARYQLFGPPTLLYYKDGELVNKQVGETGRAQFEQTLTELNK
ncbi:protein-disulfide reductase DsbD [Psychrobacter sp. M13]|uniref:protein-disulfide reductase DsbD n=1 Tax=Psychrobacter sp. M13 TaxID=3067275 RepID=UPI00352C9BEA